MTAQTLPTTPRAPRNRWRTLWVLCGLLSLGLFSISCGAFRPPALWKCECLQICLDEDGQQVASLRPINLTQLACGYTRNHARQDAARRCGRQQVDGCASTVCTCNTCFSSRSRTCRARNRGGVITGPGGGDFDDDDDVVWDFGEISDDYVDAYEESQWLDDGDGSDITDDNWLNNDDWNDDNWSDDNWSDEPDDWGDDDWGDDDWGDDDWGDDDWDDD